MITKKRRAKVLFFKKPRSIVEQFLMVLSASKSPMEVLFPGLVLSWLPNEQMFYGSICYYSGGKKEIVRKAKAERFDDMMIALADGWVKNQGKLYNEFSKTMKTATKKPTKLKGD